MFVAGWVALVAAQRRYDRTRAEARADVDEAGRRAEVAR